MNSDWTARLGRQLLAWWDQGRRDLPWRGTRDPYRVWISEIMLQQTQVAAVVPYFQRFMAAFPTVAALAAASEDQVLRLWEGLGYYRRARHLHQAAKNIVAEHAGRFPETLDEVHALPGVGRYTAGAVLSIAFDQRWPILEANTVRLYSRLLGYRGDPRSSAGQKLLWDSAESWLPENRVGDFNQALMELGSMVCKPKAPDCPNCPAADLCEARRLGLQAEIPPPKKPPVFESVQEAAVVVRRKGRVLLLRQSDQGRWSGLWDFPRFPVAGPSPEPAELAQAVERLAAVKVEGWKPLSILKHGVTRFRITLHCYTADWVSGPEACPLKGSMKWAAVDALEDFPLNATGRTIARLIS